MNMETNIIQMKKNRTIKECRAFNEDCRMVATSFIRENYFSYAGSKELALPDGSHPCNILYNLIDQFYKRECEIAQRIDIARWEAEKLSKVCWEMQRAIDRLTKENESLKAEIANRENSYMKEFISEVSKAFKGSVVVNQTGASNINYIGDFKGSVHTSTNL